MVATELRETRQSGPRAVKDLEHAQKHPTREPGDPVSTRAGWHRGSRQEVQGRKLAMNGHGKSDGCLLPAKPPNKGGGRMGRSYGGSYTGTKAETLETDKGLPTAESTGS